MQISAYDDMSSDASLAMLRRYQDKVAGDGRFSLTVSSGTTSGSGIPRGPGYARNAAIEQVRTGCGVVVRVGCAVWEGCVRPRSKSRVTVCGQCTAPFLCLLDADDTMMPTRIEKQMYDAVVVLVGGVGGAWLVVGGCWCVVRGWWCVVRVFACVLCVVSCELCVVFFAQAHGSYVCAAQ